MADSRLAFGFIRRPRCRTVFQIGEPRSRSSAQREIVFRSTSATATMASLPRRQALPPAGLGRDACQAGSLERTPVRKSSRSQRPFPNGPRSSGQSSAVAGAKANGKLRGESAPCRSVTPNCRQTATTRPSASKPAVSGNRAVRSQCNIDGLSKNDMRLAQRSQSSNRFAAGMRQNDFICFSRLGNQNVEIRNPKEISNPNAKT